MTTAYLEHFGLVRRPFTKEIAATDLWSPPSKTAVTDGVFDAIADHDSVVLTGEPGVGKTCVLRSLRERVDEAGFRLTYCQNATLGRRDFYRQLCLALGLKPSATAAALFYAVSNHITELSTERVHPVFLLDEAHLLHQDTLDHLHILLNYEWDSRALLSIVLVGLPELNDRLALRRNRSLYQRLHHRFHIEPVNRDDTAEYLRARLKGAACEHELFAPDAITLLHEVTHGALREIDRVATTALREAARARKRRVERDLMARAIGIATYQLEE